MGIIRNSKNNTWAFEDYGTVDGILTEAIEDLYAGGCGASVEGGAGTPRRRVVHFEIAGTSGGPIENVSQSPPIDGAVNDCFSGGTVWIGGPCALASPIHMRSHLLLDFQNSRVSSDIATLALFLDCTNAHLLNVRFRTSASQGTLLSLDSTSADTPNFRNHIRNVHFEAPNGGPSLIAVKLRCYGGGRNEANTVSDVVASGVGVGIRLEQVTLPAAIRSNCFRNFMVLGYQQALVDMLVPSAASASETGIEANLFSQVRGVPGVTAERGMWNLLGVANHFVRCGILGQGIDFVDWNIANTSRHTFISTHDIADVADFGVGTMLLLNDPSKSSGMGVWIRGSDGVLCDDAV